jgi:hypothetical protein
VCEDLLDGSKAWLGWYDPITLRSVTNERQFLKTLCTCHSRASGVKEWKPVRRCEVGDAIHRVTFECRQCGIVVAFTLFIGDGEQYRLVHVVTPPRRRVADAV